MKKCLLIITVASSIVLSGCHSPGVAAYYRGNKAYKKGLYTLAFSNYLYAARQGITPAQYAVAYQYYYGKGTPANYLKSTKWFTEAAPRSLRAQYALAKIQEKTGKQPWAMDLYWQHKSKNKK